MSQYREEKTEELIRHLAAEFLQRESNRTSLVTVTAVHMVDKLGKAIIYISVLPETKEQEAVEFANRQAREFREVLKKRTRLMRLPQVEFAIDYGEKNRQRIDELSNV